MKNFLFKVLYLIGVTALTAWRNRNKVLILCYHGVTERVEKDNLDIHGLHIRVTRFQAHLDYLRRKKYNFISLSEYLSARTEKRRLPQYSVVLTFDDGYRNFLTVTSQCLAKYKIPSAVFIITDEIKERVKETQIRYKWTAKDDETLLTWADLNVLKNDKKIEFGSHTCSHLRLIRLDTNEIERELGESFKLISHYFSRSVPLAYPMGMYNERIAEKARSLGYTCALTTDQGANEVDANLFTLKRTMVGDNDDEASFAVRVSGTREWLVKLKTNILFSPSLKYFHLNRNKNSNHEEQTNHSSPNRLFQ